MAKTSDVEILSPEEARSKEKEIRSKFWPTVRKALRAIPFMTDVIAAYYAMLDPETPMRAKLIIIGALAYFVAPFDVVPDFILAIGFLDDASILAAALATVATSIKDEHREAARRALADEEEKATRKA